MALSSSVIRNSAGLLTPGTSTSTFNYNPPPQGGAGAFGAVPGAVGLPSPYADLSSVFPGLGQANTSASSALISKLKGQLSPDTVNEIQNMAARLGVSGGVPSMAPGTLAYNNALSTIGKFSEQEQQQGLQDYSSLIPTVSGTQTVNPALQANIAENNATLASAPNPQQAQSYAMGLFQKYLNDLSGPAGGTSNWDHPDPTLFGVPGSAAYENTFNPRYGGV